jgi:hypothetical protein
VQAPGRLLSQDGATDVIATLEQSKDYLTGT